MLTGKEIIFKLVRTASEISPAEIAVDLSPEWLADMKQEILENFPPPPEGQWFYLGMHCFDRNLDEVEVRKRRDRISRELEIEWRVGLAAWQSYFGIGSDPG